MSNRENLKENDKTPDVVSETPYLVHSIKHLTDTTYILRFDRNGMKFTEGQHLTLGMNGDKQLREYSIYSPTNVDYLEVLIKEVEEGHVSVRLKTLKPGDIVSVEGPFGFFTIDAKKIETHKFLFIASGTGIAPFHSIIKSREKLDYTLLHGIRSGEEQYESEAYSKGCYISCTSRDNEGKYAGRVTDYLRNNEVDSNTLIYLCGNYEMIHEVYDILTNKGISPDNIRTEVYF